MNRPYGNYQEKHIGLPVIAIFLIVIILSAVSLVLYGLNFFYLVTLILGIVLLINFYSLNIEVTGKDLYYSFGLGFISNQIHTGQVVAANVGDNNALIPWSYNPTGENSLKIKLRSGKSLHLPAKQAKFMVQKLKSR